MNSTTFSRLRALGLVAALLAASAGAAQAQRAVVRGTVLSEERQPIEGASVVIPELAIQTATDNAGRFNVIVPASRVHGQTVTVRIRMIGYRPGSKTVTLAGGADLVVDFALTADVNRLEEIVVTGTMESQSKIETPFSITHVDFSDLPVPAMNPLSMLAGRVPGANIVSASGRPGAAPAVILRGPTSINATDRSQAPLYIVDGVIINGDLPSINPEDIENVEVIKGAAASSLYGARAGAGVIQITTKTGRTARDGVTWNLHTEYGRSDIEHGWILAQNTSLLMDVQNKRFCMSVTNQPLCARTFDWVTEAARINNEPGLYALQPAIFGFDPGGSTSGQVLRNNFQAKLFPGRTYNAINQVVQPKSFTTDNVDMTGRFGATQFYASGSFTQQGGAFRYLNGYNRWTARVNVDQRVGSQWSVGVRTYYAHSNEDGLNSENGGQAFFRLTRIPAIANILQTDTLGRLYVRPNLLGQGSQNENPLIDLQGRTQKNYTDRFIGGMTVRYVPFSWGDVEANLSYDWRNTLERYFRDKNFRSTNQSYYTSLIQGYYDDIRTIASSFNASISATLRKNFGQDLQSRWNFRYLYNQQDNNNNDAEGGALAALGVPDLNNATANLYVASGTSSIREIGYSAGLSLTYKDRYIAEGLIRRDGSSLFGADQRWATFGRGSVAWRIAQEPLWPLKNFFDEFKLRASRGSAGGRPNYYAQYETFGVSSGGISLNTLGNKNLKPEVTTETELGADIEILRRFGVTITHAQSTTVNQILPVPVQAYYGFGQQWKNAGTMQNKTWELSLNLPLITRRDLSWSWRFSYDQTRTRITQLDVPPFTFGVDYQQGATGIFMANPGEEYGTFYGHRFLMSCSELPSSFQSQCGGTGKAFQLNDQGFLVWTGGLSPSDGIKQNAYQAQLPAAQSPWGVAVNWGMLMTLKDTTCLDVDPAHPSYAGPRADCPAANVPIGHALPRWNFSVAQNFQWRRLSVYALFQGTIGRDVWNEARQWSTYDFITKDVDQVGRTVEEAKPIGYYYRGAYPTHSNGIGGFYDALAPNSFFVEDASYGKLRELSVSYNVGALGGFGNWTLSVIGRNLLTVTGYHGFDPEVGDYGSTTGSAVINAIDAFTFPNTRSLTFALTTSF
jgi:TonB-linked SusC/RagA family outer membrane protein